MAGVYEGVPIFFEESQSHEEGTVTVSVISRVLFFIEDEISPPGGGVCIQGKVIREEVRRSRQVRLAVSRRSGQGFFMRENGRGISLVRSFPFGRHIIYENIYGAAKGLAGHTFTGVDKVPVTF